MPAPTWHGSHTPPGTCGRLDAEQHVCPGLTAVPPPCAWPSPSCPVEKRGPHSRPDGVRCSLSHLGGQNAERRAPVLVCWGLRQTRISPSAEAGSPRGRCQQGWFLPRPLSSWRVGGLPSVHVSQSPPLVRTQSYWTRPHLPHFTFITSFKAPSTNSHIPRYWG